MESKIGKKILAVMKAVKGVEKDGFNSHFNYKFTSDAAVVGALRDAMIANGLICVPRQSYCAHENGLTTVQQDYTLIDTDSGETLSSSFFGQGKDNQDKGVYKATTGAEKYFLMKTFLLATDDDVERDENSRPEPRQTHQNDRTATKSAPADSQVAAAQKAFGDNYTSSFKVSEPMKSKKGSIYWKAIDSKGQAFFVWEDAVVADLQVAGETPVTVRLETNNGFTAIKEVLSKAA